MPGLYPSVVLMFALLLAGCGSAFRVYKNGTREKGIPFFVKTAKCEHSTAYIFPYYVITYQILSDGKVQHTDSMTISTTAYDTKPEVQQFLQILREKKDKLEQRDIDSANNAWNDIKRSKDDQVDPYSIVHKNPDGLERVANTSTPKVFVDYRDASKYALNARIPLAGSINATYKLNPDGTLSEGTAQVQDKTFETLLNLFPISEILKTAATSGLGLAEGGKPAPKSISLQGTVEKHALKITYSKIEDFTVGCDATTPIPPDNNKSFVIEEITAEDNSGKDNAKGKANEITVNGTITLPQQPKADGGAQGIGDAASAGEKKPSGGNAPATK